MVRTTLSALQHSIAKCEDGGPNYWQTSCNPTTTSGINVDRGNELPYCQQPIFSFCEGTLQVVTCGC